MGLIAQDYTSDRVAISDLYPDFCEVWVDAEQMDRVKLPPGLAVEGLVVGAPLQANEGVTFAFSPATGSRPSPLTYCSTQRSS